jgi:hypothetical protein
MPGQSADQPWLLPTGRGCCRPAVAAADRPWTCCRLLVGAADWMWLLPTGRGCCRLAVAAATRIYHPGNLGKSGKSGKSTGRPLFRQAMPAPNSY